MKTVVVITDGQTRIDLIPENEFEKDVVKKIINKPHGFNIETQVTHEYYFGSFKNEKITLSISPNKEQVEPNPRLTEQP